MQEIESEEEAESDVEEVGSVATETVGDENNQKEGQAKTKKKRRKNNRRSRNRRTRFAAGFQSSTCCLEKANIQKTHNLSMVQGSSRIYSKEQGVTFPSG
jgi:hypothetical protein